MITKNNKYSPHKVKGLSLTKWGRKKITLTESKVQELLSLRKKYKGNQPLKKARIAGYLHMTNKTLAQIGLWNNSEKYENKVYMLQRG